MLSKESLEEYKRIWKKVFNEDISDDKALETATKLLRLMRVVYGPIAQEDVDMIEKRRRETSHYEEK